MSWTPIRVDMLTALWQDGLSASQIAKELGGVTRNAVIGKVSRLGLTHDGKQQRTKSQTLTDNRLRMRAKRSTKVVALRTSTVTIGCPEPKHLSLYELTNETCKWPIGNRAPYTFCGHSTSDGSPYCEFHRKLGTTTYYVLRKDAA